MQKDLFTLAAIDNIDHNPSSSTAQNSFHGTSISIFQYPQEFETQSKFEYRRPGSLRKNSLKLPDSYTQIFPTKYLKPEPANRVPYEGAVFKKELQGITECTEKLAQLKLNDNLEERISFSAFFANKTPSVMPKTNSTLLPLIN